MGPSILQAIMREPTRSYQDIYDPNRPPSHRRQPGSSGFSSPSTSRPSSIRSSGSATSTQGPAWVNGQWEWSNFQGRKGLTGGTRSLYTPSVVGRSLGLGNQARAGGGAQSVRSAGGSVYEGSEDGRSVTSGASASGSVRTFMSAPGGGAGERRTKKKGSSSRDASESAAAPAPSGYDRASRSRSLSNSSSTTALESRRSSRFDTAPPVPKSHSSRLGSNGGADQPSRRYSSAVSSSSSTSPPLRPSFPTSPTLSSGSSPSRSKSPRSHLSSGATTPSLTSSSSSALSSEPRTPIYAVADPYLPVLTLEGDKPRKVKKSRSSKLVPLETVQPVEPVVEVETPVQEVRAPAAYPSEKPTSDDATTLPVPVPGRFYSVDEIFGAAPAGDVDDSSAKAAPHEDKPPQQDADLPVPSPFLAADPLPSPFLEAAPPLAPLKPDADETVDDATAAPGVPRLKLTRTESEQSRIGVRGSVELEVDEGDKGDSPAREKAVRRSMDEVEEEDEDEDEDEASEDETGSSEYDEDEAPTPEEPAPAARAPRVSASPAPAPAPAPPVLARFVKDKRARSGRPTQEPVVSRAPNLQPVYEVVKSSKPSRSYAPSSVSSFDAQPRSSSPANSDLSASSSGSYAYGASTDVPDWLDRIRTLGEPIQPLITSQGPQPKRQLNPPPHWTVQQLRAGGGSGSSVSSNGSSNGGRPSMPRPRSVKSLRSRAKVLEGLPEEAEAEAEAVAADEFDRRSVLSTTATLSASPAWLRKDGLSPAGSIRTSSSSANGLSRTSSLADRSSSDVPASHRRARSMDMERPRMQALSPLSRSTSTSTSASRPASTKTSSSYDFESIAASGPKPKGLAKFLQPPLASSKAVREPAPVVVRNPRTSSLRASSLYEPSSSRPSSLFDASPAPRRSLEDESDDGRSVSGLSMISVMSAPQLTPVRPPKNPARRLSSSSLIRPAVPFPAESLMQPPSRTQSPAGSIRSDFERSAPSFASFDQRTPRLSASFSAVERPIMQRPVVAPPPPAPPITTAPPAESTVAPSDLTRSTSLASRARPVSSYLPPSATSSTPTSLAIARRFDGKQQKTSRRFGLFRRSTDGDSGSKRRFEPTLDLTYDTLDANFMRKRIRSDELVVEVIAASVDRWDRERVFQLARGTNGVGFVPGRAVVGKVLEIGAEVRKVKKGELVWGLSPLRKSGGLASLVILSRDHVAAAPASLSPEISAALPSAATSAMLIMQSLCDSLPKGSKVLVLNAHTGVGYLCLQLAHHYRPGVAGSRDLWMVAQCSMSVSDGETTLREAGATDVLREEPLAAINGLHEGSFDVVIDTMGGRRLYDASRRILHNSGRFITTVGDELGESDYNTSLRSLRRAFVRKDKKQISYWRVDADGDSREAVRDTLDKVRDVVDAGALKPRVESVLPMSEARRTFDEREAELEGVVVRVREV
ncbi:hypothetical protein JCM3775_004218 [Rhodotorula graminis]